MASRPLSSSLRGVYFPRLCEEARRSNPPFLTRIILNQFPTIFLNLHHSKTNRKTMYRAKGGYVYILTNYSHTVLYTGVTSDIHHRMIQHRMQHFPNSFTSKYRCHKLVYFCFYPSIEQAIAEEKRIKGGSRQKKLNLIESLNADWFDLWERIED